MIRVVDLIGCSIVVYETEDKSDSGIAAAITASSAGVGENYKKICTCDGVNVGLGLVAVYAIQVKVFHS